MQTFLKRFSVVIGFAILVVVLIANTVVTRRQLSVQVKNDFLANHARQVLLELEEAESMLKDAETGQRGFLYTGDPRYLAPYDLAARAIDAHLAALMQMTAGDPQKQESVVELRALEQTKMAELEQTIALYRAEGFVGRRRRPAYYVAGIYPGTGDAIEMVLEVPRTERH